MLPNVTGEFRVATDPELRFTANGTPVCSMRGVASSRKQNDAGEWVDDKTCWVTLTGWKEVAENMDSSFLKGDLVLVTGRVNVEEWQDSDGRTRTTVNVSVDSIGPSVRFASANVTRGERGSTRTERAVSAAQQSTAQNDDPPF